jgi:FkbM family methyltransferase
MIHQCYFEESQRARLFDAPLYRGFGLYSSVNPDLVRNCPELEDPRHQPLLSEYGAMLHLWRNPERDLDPWIGFTSYRQLEKSPTILRDRQKLEHHLTQYDIVGWGMYNFVDMITGRPLTLFEESEWEHPGIMSCLLHLLMMHDQWLPPNYLTGTCGLYANYWAMSRADFEDFMRWSYPLVRYCLLYPDAFVASHPRSLAFLAERLYICWYGLRGKRILVVAPIKTLPRSNRWYAPPAQAAIAPPAPTETFVQLDSWNINLHELCHRHRAMPRGIIHVGAHYAQEREFYRHLGVANVLWIEADPNNLPSLRANVAPYPGAQVLQACLSDVDGQATSFYRTDNQGQSSSILPMGLHADLFRDIHVIEQTMLESITFRTLVERARVSVDQYDFLVMDVQGAELLALKGFGDHLHRMNGVYIEVNLAPLYQGCALLPDIDAYLQRYGLTRRETLITARKYGDALYLRPGVYPDPPPDLVSRRQGALEALLRARSFTYQRVGRDSRVLELLPEGNIGQGKAALEQFWLVRAAGHDVVLEFVGTYGRTCCLHQDSLGIWRGGSLLESGVTIELIPGSAARKPSTPLGFPHATNLPVDLAEALRDAFGLKHFVETGTYQGVTARTMASRFEHVHTIELEPNAFRMAAASLAEYQNVRCLQGDSSRELPRILLEIDTQALLWLDAHWSGGNTGKTATECPLLEELATVYAHRPDHVVLIDDARLFLAPPPPPHRTTDWPAFKTLAEFLGRQQPAPYVRVVGDVIVAVPRAGAEVVEAYCRERGL